MKIQFDIKFRSQIESGEYKVFAHEHEEQEARIVCWDNKGEYPIVALVDNEPEKFDKYGRVPGGNRGGEFSLFLVTPEPELSEFERAIAKYRPTTDPKETIQRIAAELLALAREQFIKDGYVIEKKAFHDAVEKIDDKQKAEMSIEYSLHCKIENGTRHAVMNWKEFQKLAQKFIDLGKNEALKDLPRWRKCADADRLDPYIIKPWIVRFDNDVITDSAIFHHGHFLCFADLEKLPVFKEDESHE